MTANIFWVDDSTIVTRLGAQALSSIGCTITTANSVEEAIEALPKLNPLPNLIISDFNMPGKTGLELVQYIKSHPPFANIPILMLTAETTQKLIEDARVMGVKGWIVKPVDDKILLSAVKKVLGIQ